MAQAPSTGTAEPTVSRHKRGGPSPSGLFATLTPPPPPAPMTRREQIEARAYQQQAEYRINSDAQDAKRRVARAEAERQTNIANQARADRQARGEPEPETVALMQEFSQAAEPGQGEKETNVRITRTDDHTEAIVPKEGADPLAQTLYNGTRSYEFSTNITNEDFKKTAQTLFDRQITYTELGDLVGAPAGSKITVTYVNPDGVLAMTISNPLYKDTQNRRIFINNRGETEIHNDYWRMDENAPNGVATQVFAREVAAAKKMGVGRISVYAAGTADESGNTEGSTPVQGAYVGYNSWARMGYDAPLPEASYDDEDGIHPGTYNELPNNIKFNGRSPTTLNELMSSPGGKEWWRANGTEFDGQFSLKDGSAQLEMLRNYLKEKKFRTGVSF